MSDLDRLLAQVEELKKLAARPDDSWMNSMSTEELQALGKRVRKVADGLSGLQTQLASGKGGPAPSGRSPNVAQRSATGSLGDLVKRDTGSKVPRPAWSPPADKPSSAASPFPGLTSNNDLSSPMNRRRVGGSPAPREAPPPSGPPSSLGNSLANPWQKPKPGERTPPPRGKNRPNL